MEYITAKEAREIVERSINQKKKEEKEELLEGIYKKIYNAIHEDSKVVFLGFALTNVDVIDFLKEKGFNIFLCQYDTTPNTMVFWD